MRKIRVFEHISLDGMIEHGARDEESQLREWQMDRTVSKSRRGRSPR